MLTMTPRRRAIMWARTARVTRKAPVRQTPSTRSHVSSDISQTGSSLLMPALLKRMSTRPKRSRVARTIASTWSFCVTSTPKAGIGRPYSALILAATSLARRAWASETTTWAPSSAKRRATACPIPAPAAAVTIATRSSSFMGLSSLSTLRREDSSGRREDAFRALSGCGGRPGRGPRYGTAEGGLALEGRHDAIVLLRPAHADPLLVRELPEELPRQRAGALAARPPEPVPLSPSAGRHRNRETSRPHCGACRHLVRVGRAGGVAPRGARPAEAGALPEARGQTVDRH